MTSKPKTSLTQRRQAVEHLIALGEKTAGDTVLAAARDAVTVLAWLEQRAELVRAFARLEADCPEVLTMLSEFPDAKVSIRRI